MQDNGFRGQDTVERLKEQDTGYRGQDTGYTKEDTGYTIQLQDTSKVQDAGYRMHTG
jgi:hypothetical protein